MKKICLTLIAIVAITHLSYAQTQWTTSGTNVYNTNSGSVGVGTVNFQAEFNVHQNTGLGGTPQNSTLLTTVSGLAGTYNNFQDNIWLVRNATGGDWTTVHLHDGISIDTSFLKPQVNTRTWWERDPYGNVQSWGNNSTTYMAISNGNVGIGTTDNVNWQLKTSIYKLAVGGGIVATAVTVKLASNWPDYVFTKDFHLSSLSDIKSYIDLNHHLPDMPSAAEIKDKGINLGEMDKLLTKKVEELTLYLIEKDKTEEVQKETNEQLITKLNKQAEQLKLLQEQIELLKHQIESIISTSKTK